MLDLFKQFFSFSKLMKDRLVVAFFFLGLVVIVMSFLGNLMDSFSMMKDGSFWEGLKAFFRSFFRILFAFVSLRLFRELMVSVFNIKDSLAPDGGKSDTADIDVFDTAKGAMTKAAKSTSSATKSAYEKTKTKIAERGSDDDDHPDYDDPTPPKKTAAKRKPAARKTAAKKKPAAKKAAPKKKT